MQFDKFDKNVLTQIILKLEPHDVLAMSYVSKQFNEFFKDTTHKIFIKLLYLHYPSFIKQESTNPGEIYKTLTLKPKAKFIFFKREKCHHSNKVYEYPDIYTSAWTKLCNDKELSLLINFELINYKMVYNNNHKWEFSGLPDKFSYIGYSPYFYYEDGQYILEGKDSISFERTYDNFKKWLISSLIENQKFIIHI